jgi:hypothetical protein
MDTLVIQTDETGAADLKAAAEGVADLQFQTRKVHAQVGDPDTWMFVTKIAVPAISALSATILLLIRQRKIKYIKIGDDEYRDISVEQFQRLMDIMNKK